MIGRLAFYAMLFGLALAATLAQLDQQARSSPALAAMVPDSFSGNAARERAKLALRLRLGDTALAEARQGVALRPMPAESLTNLSLAAAEAGDEQLALAALAASGRRGWREPVAQFASAEAALQTGDYDVASKRIAALLAIGDLREAALDQLVRLVAVREGREAMAERIAAPGHWQDNALIVPIRLAAPGDWAETLELAQAAGADIPCQQRSRIANAFRRNGEDAAAERLDPGNCRGR